MDRQTVIAMAQNLLTLRRSAGPHPRESIAKAVDDVLSLAKLDSPSLRDDAIADLESRFAITIGSPSRLIGEDDHVPWYVGSAKAIRPFYDRYHQYLIHRKGWADQSVRAVDVATDRIMELIENPAREGPWDRRGLVVGHVQSGKTSNYAGLICKAADAGYRLIVVLAGMHNALRKQTQERLDSDFLGFKAARLGAGPRERTGTGEFDARPLADYLTTREVNGDFNRARADQLGMGIGQRPVLLVVKKNASILRNINAWVREVLHRNGETGTIPLLVIDDESDQASVDTNEQEYFDGEPGEDHDPTRINGEIRKLLSAFGKSVYVAYTATPFANILIHDRGRAEGYGEDLFPRSFIVNLPAPSNYIGPNAVFGLETQDGDPIEGELPLVRTIDQEGEDWLGRGHAKGTVPVYRGQLRIPPSLETAILTFLLAGAVRRVRGQRADHNSMLVHVSRFKDVHVAVSEQIREWFDAIRNELRYGRAGNAAIRRARTLFESDCVETTGKIAGSHFLRSVPVPAWDDVHAELSPFAEEVKIVIVNSDTLSPLDYDAHKSTGLNVIAVGGDKLSRGLTLEGLTVSYFLRSSTMYDSLMQMGRWFGYRDGYVDVCRLFLPDDLAMWFRHVTTAAEELRQDLDHMARLQATPKQYGLRIQSHDFLLVTARNKMRQSEEYEVSFSGEAKIQTVFRSDLESARRNVAHADLFIGGLRAPVPGTFSQSRPGGTAATWENTFVWTDVVANKVADFLAGLELPPEAFDVNGRRLAEYIRGMVPRRELTSWTVALLGNGREREVAIGGLRVRCAGRGTSVRDVSNRYIVKTVLSPRDETIDLDEQRYAAALLRTNERRSEQGKSAAELPAGPEIRHVRGRGDEALGIPGTPDRGLLLVYPVSSVPAGLPDDVPLIGIVVSFPASINAASVRYRYNNVAMEYEAVT